MNSNIVIWNGYENNIDKIRKLQLQCGIYPIARMLYKHRVSLQTALKLLTNK